MALFSHQVLDKKPLVLIYGNNFLTEAFVQYLSIQNCEVFLLLKEKNVYPKLPPNIKYVYWDTLINAEGFEYFFDISFFDLLDKKISKTLLENYQRDFLQLLNNVSALKSKYLYLLSTDNLSFAKSNILLKSFVGKSGRHTFASLSSLRMFVETKITSFVKEKNLDARILKTRDVYGGRILTYYKGCSVISLLREALDGKQLTVVEGEFVYPTFVSDLVEASSKLMFSSGSKGKIFAVLPEKGLYSRELAYQILNYRSGLKVVYKKSSNIGREETDRENLIVAKTPLSDGLEKILGQIKGRETLPKLTNLDLQIETQRQILISLFTNDRESKKDAGGKKDRKYKGVPLVIFSVALIIIFVILPFVEFLFSASIISAQTSRIKKGQRLDTRQIAFAEKLAGWAREGVSKFYFLSFFEDKIDFVVNSSSFLILVSRAQIKTDNIEKGISELYKIVLGESDDSLYEISSLLSTELSALSYDLGFIEAELSQGAVSNLIPLEKDLLSQANQVVQEGAKLAAYLPDLLGEQSPKTYLVLFQNNSELRPTGGFIGSFGLLTFSQGKLIDIDVQDVYSADGQLKGYVEPPRQIKDFLGEASWYLRDSNWNPNFPTSAIQAEWFLDKEIDRRVDGVAAVDLYFVQDLLKVLGRVEVVDFGVEVTADNLYERTQYEVESNFFPGSKKKTTFLTALSRTLFDKLIEADEESFFKIGRSVLEGFDRKHILVYLHNKEAAKSLTKLGWDGALRTVNCQLSINNCFSDSLMVVDANLGVNKVNYFLIREMMLETSFGQDGVQHTLTVNFANKAPRTLGPNSLYKSYLRVAVPEDSEFTKATETSLTESQDKVIDTDLIDNFKTGGVLVSVIPGESKLVKVSWRRPLSLDFRQKGVYIFFWQKQPGTFEDEVNLRFSFPQEAGIVESEPQFLTSQGHLEYNSSLVRDFDGQFIWKNTP